MDWTSFAINIAIGIIIGFLAGYIFCWTLAPIH